MKSLRVNLSVIIILISIIGCGKSDNETAGDKPDNKSNTEQTQNTSSDEGEVIVIKLPTMQCGMCKKNIETAVKKIDGVKEIDVIVKKKIATVNYDKSKTDLNKIEGMIAMAGYQANEKPADKDAYDKLEGCCKLGGH